MYGDDIYKNICLISVDSSVIKTGPKKVTNPICNSGDEWSNNQYQWFTDDSAHEQHIWVKSVHNLQEKNCTHRSMSVGHAGRIWRANHKLLFLLLLLGLAWINLMVFLTSLHYPHTITSGKSSTTITTVKLKLPHSSAVVRSLTTVIKLSSTQPTFKLTQMGPLQSIYVNANKSIKNHSR